MTKIETERLILRPLTMEDSADVFEYSKNPNIGNNAGWKPHESLEETEEIMALLFVDKENIWGIQFKDESKIIGSLGLMDDPKRQNFAVRMLGYSLGEPWWNRGIMTEAVRAVCQYGFSELNLSAISACTFPFNKPSKSVLTKCGFRYEATLSLAEKTYDGHIYDHDCYLLRSNSFKNADFGHVH